MAYEKNSDALYVKVSADDDRQNILGSPGNKALKSGGQSRDAAHSDPPNETDRALLAGEGGYTSEPGVGRFCTWKVTAIVFITLSALLLISIVTTGGIWLKETDELATSQKTSMEQAKRREEEEEQKRVERERQIRAEEEQKRTDREQEIREEEEKKREEMEQEIRAEEEKKRQDLEQDVRREEEEKRQALEKLLEEKERTLEELRAQCVGAETNGGGSSGIGVLLPLLLLTILNCLSMVY